MSNFFNPFLKMLLRNLPVFALLSSGSSFPCKSFATDVHQRSMVILPLPVPTSSPAARQPLDLRSLLLVGFSNFRL